MKRLLIATVAMATLVGPVAALAQDNGDVRQDRREVSRDKDQTQQDRNHARRDGVVTPAEHRGLQNDRRDVAGARQGLRADVRGGRFDRNNRNWWQGRSDFRGYNGRRPGFWFAPGYGYRPVDQRWSNYNWTRGAFVPVGYRNFYVQDPIFYGLRPAPYGARWVYVDNNLVLMSLATGVILDVVAGAY